MPNQSRCRCRTAQATSAAVQTTRAAARTAEPPVHRWSHPITDGVTPQQGDPTLHYIRCALSYQNQMLADIKALLQQLVDADLVKKEDD